MLWHINYLPAHLSHNMGEGPPSSTEICLSLLKPQLITLHTFYGLLSPPRPCREFMGSFSCRYLQFLLWPPAYKSRCQVSLEFILLHSQRLLFSLLPPILSCRSPTVSALDTHGVRCLWTVFTSHLADNCIFGSGGQE